MKFDMKVLLVDDDEEFATGLSILLEKLNIATVLAHRIASAEKQLENQTSMLSYWTLCYPKVTALSFYQLFAK